MREEGRGREAQRLFIAVAWFIAENYRQFAKTQPGFRHN